ncbi:MAG: hypothetical protein M0Z77_03725 [Thermoplasmatales archaeon]|nr:hypothetical protein [Thermoplasmatales archaeon]
MEPEDMQEWVSILWMKHHKMMMKSENMLSKELIFLMKRVTMLKERMGEDKRVMSAVDWRHDIKAKNGKERKNEDGSG